MNHHGWFLRPPGRSTAPIAAAPQPLNLYGETKWQGEQIIRSRSPELLGGHIVLRLASVYGGLFDLSERLIPSLAARCMTNDAVELNGGDQIFDFVHVNDVVESLLKAVSMLQKPSESVEISHIAEEYLLCSGEHTTAKQILSYICSLTSCGSPLNIRPADTRYPSNFVCDNARMRHGLGHKPLYPDIKSGLATYLRSMFDRDIRLLTHSYENYCAGNNTSRNASLSGELQDRKWPRSMHSDDTFPLLPEQTLICDHLLNTFKKISVVKPSSEREFLVYFGGSTNDDSSAFLTDTMFPNSNVKLGDIQDHGKYMQVLNNSVFCPQMVENTGWTASLVESIYAGCIPVLTSDVVHPPFWDVLEWSKFAVHVHWSRLNDIEQTLKSLSPTDVNEKQAWLLKVRDAFLYNLDVIDQEQHWLRKGPLFHTILSLQVK